MPRETSNVIRSILENKQGEGLLRLVKKRDGHVVPFEAEKIAAAITKAFEAVGEGSEITAWEVTGVVIARLEEPVIEIETIQDFVEDALMNMGFRRTAKAYILYRAKRTEVRDVNRAFKESHELIDDYIGLHDWRINENSNMSFSLQGLNSHIASSLTADYWLSKIYPPEIGNAHRQGYIHIHDLGSLSSYCVGWDLEQFLIMGFNGVPGKVGSRPAKHFGTALGQIVNFFFTLQGEAAGAQAFANFDTLLAPFIRYDGLSYKQVKQAMQEFIYNINVPTRNGFQSPFTNVTMDLVVPSYLKDKAVIIGGELQDDVYGDFQAEMDQLNRAFAEIMTEGDANNRPFTFPIPTYNITKNFDWDNPEFEAIWKMTAKYGAPYFSNFINSDMSEEDARSMCCRLRLDNREVKDQLNKHAEKPTPGNTEGVRRGGLFSANPMTGSIGVVTVNLPRLAYESKDENEFFEKVEHYMEIARTSLELKRKMVENLTDVGLYPYTKIYLRDIKKRSGKFWTNHFSTIGLIGMNEAMLNLHHANYFDDKGTEFGVRTLDFMLERLDLFRRETGNLYNLEASPAEGASYRLAKADRKKHPEILTSGTTDTPYYTNSVHLPVNATDDIFELLDHQDELQARFTGGTVVHIFLGESIKDPAMVKKIVNKVSNEYKLPYFSLTPTFSICPVHGYISGEHEVCPYDHSEADLERFGIYKNETKSLK